MSELSFKDGEVVWVKWRSVWWPGEVWDSSRVPNEVLTSLRKPVSIFVRFFQEEAFEYVRNLDNIEKYNCERKMDYIKKGMEKFKSNKKVMTNFPADVQRAEELTKGNVNILKTFETPAKPAPATSTSPSLSTSSPKVETNVSSKKQLGQYNSAEKVQTSSGSASKPENKKYTCTMCHFSTDRMNLLMFHIKNHSSTFVTKVHDPPSSANKKSFTKSPAKKSIPEDTIADDVRKIKESMKVEEKKTTTKKTRESTSSTPTNSAPSTSTGRGRSARKEDKKSLVVVETDKKKKVAEVKVESPPAVNTLKNEILADWSDEDDDNDDLSFIKKQADALKADIDEKPEPVSTSEEKPSLTVATPTLSPADDATSHYTGKTSRSIRNIPKKQQRINEVFVKPECEATKNEQSEPEKADIEGSQQKSEDEEVTSKKGRGANRRKQQQNQQVDNTTVEDSKPEQNDDLHLLATANELLNETEVPKVDDAQKQSSTFHKSNDIEKRNLPPKERNKRIFRATESASPNNGTSKDKDENESLVISEMKLPHKKKQSSRLLSNEKPSTELTRRKRKSEVDVVVNQNSESVAIAEDVEMKDDLSLLERSPLRETKEEDLITTPPRRGQKRKNSEDSQPKNIEPKPKKIHSVDDEDDNGVVEELAVDSVNNSESLTSPMKDESPSKLISKIPKNALKFPAERVIELKKQGLVTVGSDMKNKLTEKGKQIYKEIELRGKEMFEKTVSAEDVVMEIAAPNNSQEVVEDKETIHEDEMKPSSMTTTTQNDSPNISTNSIDSQDEENSQEISDVEESLEEKENETEDALEPSSTQEAFASQEKLSLDDEHENEKTIDDEVVIAEKEVEKVNNNDDKLEKIENVSEIDSQETVEADEKPEDIEAIEESLNNNTSIITEEKSPKENISFPSEHQQEEETETTPVENGKEAENEANEDEANSGGAGLIALQAESFGGPPNCFYLCRTVDDRYVPVNNQILVLNAQNALVPYEGDISDETISQTEAANDISVLPQLSPNSNIIISTQSGQKIELNAQTIMTLQQQADENGVASFDVSGEQIELNINEILEALSSNTENSEMMIVDNDAALVLETSIDLPVEAHHTATHVSETLSKPIMSTTVAPEITSVKTTTIIESVANKTLNIEDSLATIGVTTPNRANVPKSLELPITVTNSTIAKTVNHRELANATVIISDVPSEESAILITSATISTEDNDAE